MTMTDGNPVLVIAPCAQTICCLIALSGLLVSATPLFPQSGFRVTIKAIEARCVESTATGGRRSSNPELHINVSAGYRFRLNVTLHIPDTSVWSDSAFAIVGSLPDGDTFRQIIQRRDVAKVPGAGYWFAFDVSTRKLGWANFIVMPATNETKPALSDYVGSGKRGVNLQCPESQDTGD